MSDTTIADNIAASSGGGIANTAGLTVTDSTFVGNFGYNGGGLIDYQFFSASAAASIADSTFTANTATSRGGAIFNAGGGAMTLDSSTLSGNTANLHGDGIYNNDANQSGVLLGLTNSIVAGNITPTVQMCLARFSHRAADLIGNGAGMTGITNGDANGNEVGTGTNPINPLLGALANNGGLTQTMAPLPGSPAIATGSTNSVATFDQRGVARPVNSPLTSARPDQRHQRDATDHHRDRGPVVQRHGDHLHRRFACDQRRFQRHHQLGRWYQHARHHRRVQRQLHSQRQPHIPRRRRYIASATITDANGRSAVASTAPAVWSTLPSTAVRHVWGATVTGPDGRIYIMGGGDSNGQFNTVEAYDPATATWTTVAPLLTPLQNFSAATANDRIYVFGGDTTNDLSSRTGAVESYDPATNTWSYVASMPVATPSPPRPWGRTE